MNNYAMQRDVLQALGPVLDGHGLAFQALSLERVRRRFWERGPDRVFVIVEVQER